jgi:hypothetical protein
MDAGYAGMECEADERVENGGVRVICRIRALQEAPSGALDADLDSQMTTDGQSRESNEHDNFKRRLSGESPTDS